MTGNGRMVVQLATDFLAGGSYPGRVHRPAAPPMAADWQGFELPTTKTAVGCATIRPVWLRQECASPLLGPF